MDKWLWCARIMRARSECADLVAQGVIRINRQATAKPHAKLRIGDVLTIPLRNEVRVLRVARLALRRGSSTDATLLYADVADVSATSCAASATACAATDSSAYREA